MFSLLVVGLSLASGLVALVPVVQRDAHAQHQLERVQYFLTGSTYYAFID